MNEAEVLAVLGEVVDPEIGLDIVAIGLVYEVVIGDADLRVVMTLTSAGCPMQQMLMDTVRRRLASAFPATNVTVELVWEPAWTPDRLSQAAQARLGL